MTIVKKIFTNTAWQIAGRILEIAIGIYTLSLITRYLGQEGYGYYVTATAFLQLFFIIVDFGLYLTLLRELSANTSRSLQDITNNIFTLRLISAGILLAAAVVAVAFMPYADEVKYGVAAMSWSFLLLSLVTVLTAVFQNKLSMGKIAAANVINKLVFLGLIVAIITQQGLLQQVFYATSIASLVAFAVVWYAARPYMRLRLRFDLDYWKEIMSKSWPLAVTIALNLIYFKADTVILSLYYPAGTVGLYGAAYKVIEIITAFPHMFMGLLLPLMTVAWIKQDHEGLRRLCQQAFNFFAFITLPAIFGTLAVARPLMSLLAGSSFAAAGPILKILMIAAGAIFFGTLYTYLVLVLGRQRAMIKYFLITAAVALIGYLIFIPLYSYWAAAWITVISEIMIPIGAWLAVRRQLRFRWELNTLAKLLASSAAMSVVAWGLQLFVPLWLVITVSAVCYFLLVLGFDAFNLRQLKQLIRT